jgi:hypothetical protein
MVLKHTINIGDLFQLRPLIKRSAMIATAQSILKTFAVLVEAIQYMNIKCATNALNGTKNVNLKKRI